MKRKTILSFITGLFLLGGLSSCMDLDEQYMTSCPLMILASQRPS